MRITKIRLQEEHPMAAPSGTPAWPLPIFDLNVNSMAGENGYILKVADGIEPPVFLAVVEGYDVNGVSVMTSVPQTRDIGFRIGLQPHLGQSFSDLRDDLYKLISRSIYVRFMHGADIVAQGVGFIKQFDSSHFVNLPEVAIIVECQDGSFSAPRPVAIPLEEIQTVDPIINYTEGTAPTGLDLQFSVHAPFGQLVDALAVTPSPTSFNITEYSKFWAMSGAEVHNVFQVNYPFLPGDVINMSTYPKKRRITVTRSGAVIDLAGYVNAGAVWPKVFPGVNAFHWTLDSSWMTWVSATYTPRFWGV